MNALDDLINSQLSANFKKTQLKTNDMGCGVLAVKVYLNHFKTAKEVVAIFSTARVASKNTSHEHQG